MDKQWAEYLEVARREVEHGRARDPKLFPHYSEDGTWQLLDVSSRSSWDGERYEHGNWTAGFWFGTAWLAGLDGAGAIDPIEAAAPRLPGLVERAEDHTTHDLGFLFFLDNPIRHGRDPDSCLLVTTNRLMISAASAKSGEVVQDTPHRAETRQASAADRSPQRRHEMCESSQLHTRQIYPESTASGACQSYSDFATDATPTV